MKNIFRLAAVTLLSLWGQIDFRLRQLVRNLADFGNEFNQADSSEKIEKLVNQYGHIKQAIIPVANKLMAKTYKTEIAALQDLHKHFSALKTEKEKALFLKKLLRHIAFELLPEDEEDEVRLLLDLWQVGKSNLLNFH